MCRQGNVCFAEGDVDAACRCYREALGKGASCPEALFNLGHATTSSALLMLPP